MQFWAGQTYVDYEVLQGSTDVLKIIVSNCDPVCMAMQDRREHKGIKHSLITNTKGTVRGEWKEKTQ